MPDIEIRPMTIDDYDGVFALWESIEGFALRSIDDSREGIERFLRQNPSTSIIALADGKVVGSVLCGHDGRQGRLYHVCVAAEYRRRNIGRRMVETSLAALKAEGINKVALVTFKFKEGSNSFWEHIGFKPRLDLNPYELMLNEDNVVAVVE